MVLENMHYMAGWDHILVITRIDFCNSAVKNARGMWQ